MKHLMISCIILFSIQGFSQRNFNYFFDLRDAQDTQDYPKILELASHELKYVDDSISMSRCYGAISNAYYNIRQYDSALMTIQKSMQLKLYESHYNNRGDIYLKLNNRDSACADFKRAKQPRYNNRIKKHCAPNWDYDKVYKGFCNDTSLFEFYVTSYYKGCYKKITDTVYKCKLPKEKVIHWQMFYDKDLTKIRKEKFVVGDTSKTINYYSNGIKSKDIWELQDQYKWILDAKYWMNGTLCYKLNPSDQGFQKIKHFWSNGKVMFEGDWEAGRFYGDVISYHPNGKIKKIKHLLPYSKKDESSYNKYSIKVDFFDDEGRLITIVPDTITRNINFLGAPSVTFNYLEEWKEYLKIDNLVAKETVFNSEGYSPVMEGLKAKVYKKAKFNFETDCKCGETIIEMVIDEKGKIGHIRVTTANNPEIDEMFLKAVKKIKKWKVAKLNGKPVNVLLKLNLALEDIYPD